MPDAPVAVARRTDPETSHGAARGLSVEWLRKSQRLVLDALRSLPTGGTDEAIRDRLAEMGVRISLSGARNVPR